MTGPLCDTALEVTGSLARLRELESSSLLIQPTEPSRYAYRYHPLLREVLRAELHATRPGEDEAIAARAARWYHGQGQMLEALEFANRSGDRDLLATLMTANVWPLHWSGRIATLERWVGEFDREGVRERYPQVAAVAGFVCVIDGRRHEAELWLAAGEAAQGPDLMPEGSTRQSWLAVLRGLMLGHGVDALIADAETAEAGMRPDSPFMPGVRLMRVIVAWLSGRPDEALALAADVAAGAAARGAMPGYAMATGIESSLALRAGQGRRARAVVEAAIGKIAATGMSEYVLAAPLYAVAARVALINGNPDEARAHLARVHRSRPHLTDSAPWLSVPARLDAIEALIALRDIAPARTLMREVEDILRVRPHLGTITDDVRAAQERLVAITEAGGGHWTLTAAELRVLQYLPTHLTFGEIAERLYVSPHTVKSQAVAIYSKLGVSARRAAIEKSVEVGLLDGAALRYPLGPEADIGIG
jgi:LuxR family maltose regulon positive regulatory protein